MPHIHVAGPFGADPLPVPESTSIHLAKVLRYRSGEPVTYTDGVGTFGEGTWGEGVINRGVEASVERPTGATIAVAAPKQKDRARFVVEKAQELGVAHLRWLATDYGEGRPPAPTRSNAWAVGALEQSRGAWLMDIEGPMALKDLGVVVGCDASGPVIRSVAQDGNPVVTIAIGPEGGWSDKELAQFASTVSLGSTVLRVETAVVVAAVLIPRAGV